METSFQRTHSATRSFCLYHPNTHDDKVRCHKYGNKTLQAIFLGYHQRSGGAWSGQCWVVDCEELENAEYISGVYPKWFHHKEIIFDKKTAEDEWYFPLYEGDIRQPGQPSHSQQLERTIKQKRAQRKQDNTPPAQPDNTTDNAQQPTDNAQQPEEEPDESQDFWALPNNDVLIRFHRGPRSKLYIPTQDNCPLPLKYLDVLRRTTTDLEDLAEREIEDFWVTDGNDQNPSRSLSHPWTGKTVFHILKPHPKPGYQWVMGEEIKRRQSQRPDDVLPELWTHFSKAQRQQEIARWKIENARRRKARHARNIFHIPESELTTYNQKLIDTRTALSLNHAPTMPSVMNCVAAPSHEDHIAPKGASSVNYWAMVHTPISIKKALQIPKAKEALDKEWHKLMVTRKIWNLDSVVPRAAVIEWARRTGTKVHFGTVMDLCSIKHSELADEFRKYKGRVVFRGDYITDEYGMFAVFTEQGASASHIQAANILDAVASLPGCDGEDADAVGAYTQLTMREAYKLLGTNTPYIETFVTLPKDRQPASWANIEDPVCIMDGNLYGHPIAGLLWEIHSHNLIKKAGFEPVTAWECLFVHKQKQLFLSVYVDDFKLAGKKENIVPMWKALQDTGIELDPPVSLHGDVYLGRAQYNCHNDTVLIQRQQTLNHRLTNATVSNISTDLTQIEQTMAKMGQPIDPLQTKPTPKTKAKAKATPAPPTTPTQLNATTHPRIKSWPYVMTGHAIQSVERYLELTKQPESILKRVPTPCLDDHQLTAEDMIAPGKVAATAARIVLKSLYLARLARPEIYWTVNALAREVTKWTVACDKRLYRLICWIHFQRDWTLKCFLGDNVEDTYLAMFCDASFAGDLIGSKSTSGCYLCIVGPNSFVPIAWMVKKQGAVSHSSSEAEIIALDAAVRMEGIPCLLLWELITDVLGKPVPHTPLRPRKTDKSRPRELYAYLESVDYVPCSLPPSNNLTKLIIMEDNESVIQMIIKGRAPQMRHVPRTHRVNLDWLIERLNEDDSIRMRYVGTKEQLADFLTKGNFTAEQWKTLCQLALIGPPLPNLDK